MISGLYAFCCQRLLWRHLRPQIDGYVYALQALAVLQGQKGKSCRRNSISTPCSCASFAKLLEETGLSEIEYVEGDKKIRCAVTRGAIVHTAAPAPAAAISVSQEAATAEPPALQGTPVTAPMVGTVYLGPSPDAAPFVRAGDKVKAGDTLLIIEAMKVMNPIKA